MARNRKRANQRRRTQPVGARPVERPLGASGGENDAPDPLEHASPDAELVAAQLAAAQPDLSEEFDSAEDEEELDELATGGDGDAGSGSEVGPPGGGNGGGGRELAVPGGAAPAHREPVVTRLMGFLRGSWAELQRVQWPDRRQVMQATGVVIGFVIVAGVFLGVADWAAGKIMTYVLK